jgi:hypothetical protein
MGPPASTSVYRLYAEQVRRNLLCLSSPRSIHREMIQRRQSPGTIREELSVSENGGRRGLRVLSPESKWEIFLRVTSGDITQPDAARKWHVDVSTIVGIRRTVKDAALAACRPSLGVG